MAMIPVRRAGIMRLWSVPVDRKRSAIASPRNYGKNRLHRALQVGRAKLRPWKKRNVTACPSAVVRSSAAALPVVLPRRCDNGAPSGAWSMPKITLEALHGYALWRSINCYDHHPGCFSITDASQIRSWQVRLEICPRYGEKFMPPEEDAPGYEIVWPDNSLLST